MEKRGLRSIFLLLVFVIVVICFYHSTDLLASTYEPNIDRPGSNYKNFNLPAPDYHLCEQACEKDPQCKAFTYVKPGIQGKAARCWLKNSVPEAKKSNCCISGVKSLQQNEHYSRVRAPSQSGVSNRIALTGPIAAATNQKPVSIRNLSTAAKIMKFPKPVIFHPIQGITNAGGKGPSPQQLDVLVGSGIDQVLFERGCALEQWVYEDREKTSGLYYFYPREFRLAWDPRSGYLISFQYNKKEDASDKTSVLMTATLVGGYNIADRNILEHLLKDNLKGKQSFKALKPLPIYDMKISLEALAVGFDIPDEQITATSVNNIAGKIRITVAMTETNIEEVIAALQSFQGIGGYFSFPLEEGENPTAVSIPIHLSFWNYALLEQKNWKRGDPYNNLSDFPVCLKKLTVLTKRQNRIESYEYNLGNIMIPPRKVLPIQASAIRTDANALKYIFETEVKCNECPECMNKVVAELRKGITQTRIENLEVTVIPNVFTEFNLFEVLFLAESRFFNPVATGLVTREIKLTAQNNVSRDIPVYLGATNIIRSAPVLRYRISVITNDGEKLDSGQWIESDVVKGNYIGKNQIEPIMNKKTGGHGSSQRDLF